MNNVERLKRVKELLEPFKHVEMGVHVPGKPVCPTSGAYYSSWDDGEYMAKQALTIIDELIDQQAKGVDVLTEKGNVEYNHDIAKWIDHNGGGWTYHVNGKLTHWMPLPKPPQTEGNKP